VLKTQHVEAVLRAIDMQMMGAWTLRATLNGPRHGCGGTLKDEAKRLNAVQRPHGPGTANPALDQQKVNRNRQIARDWFI